jgi:hypothetical protein
MERHDWFRNTSWSDAVATSFEEKLRRARDKSQALRIQACMLAEARPEIAHALLDRYFACEPQIDRAQAFVDRAQAFLAQRNVSDALCAYTSTYKWDSTNLP